MKKALAIAAALVCCVAHQAQAGQLAPALEDRMRGMNGTDEVKVLVVLREQADIASLDVRLGVIRAPMSQRHREVIDTLRDVASRTQGPIIQELSTGTGVRGFTPYWIMNALTVVGTVDAIRDLAERPDVELIESDLRVELIEPLPADRKEGAVPRGSITPGVLAIQADRVWNELGIDGTGALVGNMDTGVDGTHPALSARWRGNFAPADECWRDAIPFGDATPRDRHGHGTHTMGTIAGTAPGNEIGVAPGALWIADNSINQGVGSAFDNDVLAGLQWFADPDGNSGTTDDVPDVVQHSWGVYEGLGYPDCFSLWWTALDNCEAAGVVNTWSAGNEGPGSASLRSPADRSSSPYNAFSVGATQASPPYTIASFSSRGPSTCPGTPFPIKPEVSAPGVQTWSAAPGGGYQFLSGTSMAGPHVAGVVALMRAANPDVDVNTVKQILMDTATDLGAAGEDNTYGHGIVNAYEAVLAVLSGYGQATGTVTESGSGTPIAGAFIDVLGDPRSDIADTNGDFALFLPAGGYTLEYSAFGYVTTTRGVTVLENEAVDASQAMVLAPQVAVSGIVRDFTGATVEGATITVVDTPLSPVLSLADGTYSIAVPDLATYDIQARKDGFGADQRTVVVSGNTTQNFTLPELVYEDFESGDFSSWPWSFGGNAPWTIDNSNPYEGAYSARSGSISHNQQSSMRITLTLAAGGDLSFWYRVSSEANYDFLRFYIDGVQQNSWAGSIGWTEATYAVAAGERTFEWRYTKDGSVSTGSDAAWVDFINFPNTAVPEVEIVPTSLEEVLTYDQQVGRNLTIQNLGTAPLVYTVELVGLGGLESDLGNDDLATEAALPEWLDVSPMGGTVDPQSSTDLLVTFDSTGLLDGTYVKTIRIHSNDSDESIVDVIARLTVTAGATDVSLDTLPVAFQLAAPRPNPFGPATAIDYAVPAGGAAVRIVVFDVSGRLVRTLVDETRPAGRHSVSWDGRDSGGRRVASGSYFYRMDAGDFSKVQKVTLLK